MTSGQTIGKEVRNVTRSGRGVVTAKVALRFKLIPRENMRSNSVTPLEDIKF